jgi:transposase
MLRIEMYITIKTLNEKGHSKAEISRLTGYDWKTVAKVIKQLKSGQERPVKKPHPKRLDDHKDQILNWLEQGLSSVRIYENFKREGLAIGYSSVKYFVKGIKGRSDICIRFSTVAGEEAQVDFGYVGLTATIGIKRRKTWVFNMRLSYSRKDYYEKVYDQKVETFIQCHINAFEYFGGVPRCVKIDNLKAAILEANFYEPIYQEQYKNFAKYYGFSPMPCRVRKPQEKGKVESGIKYVKNNFFKGRQFNNEEDVNFQLREWLENTCNSRIHGTTRKIPNELFEQEEKEKLIKLPLIAYRLPRVGQRTVYRDCHVYIEYNYYSVPYKYVGKDVDIEIDTKLVRISYQGEQIALHQLCDGKGKFSTDESHYPEYKKFNLAEYQNTYQTKMAAIGNHALKLFEILLEQQPYHWYQTTKGILSLRNTYSDSIINLSCQRALVYGAICYRQIKSICTQGCYTLPLDGAEEHYGNT